MRFLVGVGVLIGALLLPSAAHAQVPIVPATNCSDICGLDLYFVNQYTRSDSNYYRAHAASVMAKKGVRRPYRDATREAIYAAKASEGNAISEWCKKHSKACKAAVACITAAVTSIHKDLNDNEAKDPKNRKSSGTIMKDAAGLCAIAAAAVYVAVP